MGVLLWLDDLRNPVRFPELIDLSRFDKVVWVKDFAAFKQEVTEHGLPAFVSFDHDLGEAESGYDCAKWLVDYCMGGETPLPLPGWQVHSANPVGRKNIESLFASYVKWLTL